MYIIGADLAKDSDKTVMVIVGEDGQIVGRLCPNCGQGIDTDGDGDCGLCGGSVNGHN
jgi:hypothetical protein